MTGNEGESLGDDGYSRTIDKLRELGIADLVPLPQLVVVGDQSSGKSSVLESVTGFAFPRYPELCTRYATQITCRRDDTESVHVMIIPSQESNDDRKERLRAFVYSVQKNDMALADVFAKVRRDNHRVIWENRTNNFSRRIRPWGFAASKTEVPRAQHSPRTS